MSSNIKVPTLLLILSTLILSCPASDDEGDNLCNHWYDVVASNSISPDQTSYRIGDTITIRSIIPRFAFDRNKGRSITIESINLTHSSFVLRTDLNEFIYDDAERNVEVLLDEPSVLGDLIIDGAGGPVSIVKGNFEKLEDDSFAIGYRMVLTTAGDYWYRFGNHRGFGDVQVEVEDGCLNNTALMYYQVDSDHNSNIDYLCESPFYTCDRWIEDDGQPFHENGGYIFRVLP